MAKDIINPVKFGTDGWRGIIADDFTFENVRVCAQATAEHFITAGLASRGMVIGYDFRFASEDFAAAVAEVLAGNGIKVYLSPRPVATPVVSFANTVLGSNKMIACVHTAVVFNDEHPPAGRCRTMKSPARYCSRLVLPPATGRARR